MTDALEKTTRDDAARVIAIEAAAVGALGSQIGPGFMGAVEAILASRGRTILVGIGKSGIIAQKIAATLSSTGTPSYFLHPTEGMHGDLGILRPEDVVIAVSHSGETAEISALLPALKSRGGKLVALTGNPDSTLGRAADFVVVAAVDREACPLGLVPTASTTAALVMGDALAVCVMKRRNFRQEDFAAVHPGGSLGRRLLSSVAELGHRGAEIPIVAATASFSQAVVEIDAKKLGITAVVAGDGKLVGVLTDGDVRRLVAHGSVPAHATAGDVMSREPKTIPLTATGAQALHLMETYQITALFAPDEAGRPAAVVHIHDLLGRGAATANWE